MCVRAGFDAPGVWEFLRKWLIKNAVPPVATLLLAFGILLEACGGWWTPPHTADVVTDVVDTGKVVLCIVDHSQESPAQILKDCPNAIPSLIDDTLNTLQRAEVRDGVVGCPKAMRKP
jgi:hypothetical protein